MSQVELDDLGPKLFAEIKRRLDHEPDKLPGTSFPKLIEFFAAREERKLLEEKAKAEAEARETDPLETILGAGLPPRRKVELLMDMAKNVRAELDRVEQAIQFLTEEE